MCVFFFFLLKQIADHYNECGTPSDASKAVVPKLLRVGTHYLLPQLTATHLTLFNQQNIDEGN